MTYTFFYTESNGNQITFRGLSKCKAVMLYNAYLRDMALYDYKLVGWKVE